MKYLLLLVTAILLTACSQNDYLYYGNYSQSYYQAVKNPDFIRTANYKKSLEDVFTKSDLRGLPVPPGLYCDYAMLLVKEGDTSTARVFFEKEKALWPESVRIVNHLMSRYGM